VERRHSGNVVDFSPGYNPENLEEDIRGVVRTELPIDRSDELFEGLKNSKTLLYLVDN